MTIKDYYFIISLVVIIAIITGCSGDSDIEYYNLTLKTEPEGQGTVRPGSGQYKENEQIELEAKADGFIFKEWQGAGLDGEQETNQTLIMDNDYVITAVFEKADLTGRAHINNQVSASSLEATKNNNLSTLQSSSQLAQTSTLEDNQQSANYKAGEVIIKYRATSSIQTRKKVESDYNLKTLEQSNSQNRVVRYQLPEDKSVLQATKEYQQNSNIEYVQPNYIYQLSRVPNDKYYKSSNNSSDIQQWGPGNLNLEAAWEQETGSTSVTIAVVDTGIIPDHPDLDINISSHGYDVIDDDGEPYDLSFNSGVRGHGTHVAGIIGARGNNELGVAGTNWTVTILPIRVLGDNRGDTSTVTAGIEYAVNNGADIINLSLGGDIKDPNLKEAIDRAVEEEILVFAAAGNDGADTVLYPAAYDNVVAVGAVDQENQHSSYSNYGPQLDLVAPGDNIYSTYGHYTNPGFDTDYQVMSGTSMATPYVSGIAGLLLAKGVSPARVVQRLKTTARDLGSTGIDEKYGYGLVDAYGAMIEQKIKVFAARKDGATLIIQSEIEEVANGETYDLNLMDDSEIDLVGWIDLNNNNQIDAGDYYVRNPVPDDDSNQTIDLQLNYIDSHDNNLPLDVEGLN
ncbi:MAG: S8 family serine peptidase [Bacillota bacterium]